jgi:hypothetical protein
VLQNGDELRVVTKRGVRASRAWVDDAQLRSTQTKILAVVQGEEEETKRLGLDSGTMGSSFLKTTYPICLKGPSAPAWILTQPRRQLAPARVKSKR